MRIGFAPNYTRTAVFSRSIWFSIRSTAICSVSISKASLAPAVLYSSERHQIPLLWLTFRAAISVEYFVSPGCEPFFKRRLRRRALRREERSVSIRMLYHFTISNGSIAVFGDNVLEGGRIGKGSFR